MMSNIEINHHTFSDVMELVTDVQALHPAAKLIGITSKSGDLLLRIKFEWCEMWAAMPLGLTYDQREELANRINQDAQALKPAKEG